MTRMMRDLVEVQGSFKPSVRLPGDFFDEGLNRHFVESYIPTPETLDIFMQVQESLQSDSSDRAKIFTGTFGTGKSDLMLMIANYVTRSPDDPLLEPFFKRLARLDREKAKQIYLARQRTPPYLLVLLQAEQAKSFSSFALDGLSGSLVDTEQSHLLGTTYYKAAQDLIQEWENDRLDNIERLEETLVADHAVSFEQLKEQLGGPDGDSALAIFSQAASKASGMPFHANAVIKNPSEGFISVAQQLVESGQYSGIFVIVDEFTHLLQELANSPGAGDSKAIDNLAEEASRSGANPLHFYIVSLDPFASVRGSSQHAQAALERIGGRFKQHELRSQNTEELISASITKLVSRQHLFEGAREQEEELLNLAERLWSAKEQPRTWLYKTVVQGCFPLHPLATSCLRPLNAVLAQNERTMFSFIWDKQNGVNRFIQQASAEVSNGHIELLSLEGLFGYFEITLKEKRPDLWQVYQESRGRLSPPQFESGLEGQLLRGLIMLEVAASGGANLRADREILRHALDLPVSELPEMTNALEQLGKHGVAYRSPNNDYYQLIKPGRANPSEVQRLIEERSRELQVRGLDELNAAPVQQATHVEASRYNSQRGTFRQLSAQFVSPTELPTLSLPFAEQDGLLWYVVSPSKQELMQARSDALQRTRQHDQLVVAVPRRPTDLLKRWNEKQALELLRNNPDYQSSDYQELLDDRGLVGEEYLKAFTQERRWFNKPQNFEWFRAGEPIKVTSTSDLSSLATKMMRDVFPATPAHNAKQHFNPRKGSRTRVQALEKILQAPFNLPSTGNSTLKFILLHGASELGLIYKVKSEGGYDDYDLCQPVEPLSLAVWNVLDDDLRQEIPWSEVVTKLKGRPYGLYPSVLQLFSAAFYKFNQDYLEIYKTIRADEQPIDITSREIIHLIQYPEQYTIRYQPLTDAERQFLAGLEGTWSTPSEQSGGGLRNRVVNSLREWFNQLPPIAQNASADELTTVFSSVSSETIQACALLLKAANHSSQAQTATILLDKLPTRLGLSADHSQWTETNIKPALQQLERAVLQLENFSTPFKAQLTWQIAQRFGFTERPFNWDEILNAALSWRAEWNVQAEQFAQNSEAKVLVSTLDEKPTDFEYVFLKYLPSSWGLKKFERWSKIRTRDDYIKRLEQAKAAVEAKAAELAASPPTTKPVSPPQKPSISPSPDVPARSDRPDTAKPDRATDRSTSEGNQYTLNPSHKIIADASQGFNGESPVQQAFTKIKKIFNRLSGQDQAALWERLESDLSQRLRSSGAQAGQR